MVISVLFPALLVAFTLRHESFKLPERAVTFSGLAAESLLDEGSSAESLLEEGSSAFAAEFTRRAAEEHAARLQASGTTVGQGWASLTVPARFEGEKQRVPVLFAVQTSHIPIYEAKLRAEFDTWLSTLSPMERIVLGPKCDAGMSCKDVQWDSSICQDNSQWCKAAAVLDRAFQEKDFDWLVQGYEDDYVNTDNIKNLLQKRDPSNPVVYAGFGCASWGALKEVGYSNQSIADFHICPAVLEHGGLCGGSGIIFSRAAVDRLFADGREAFWRRVYSYPSTIQCDIGTGCLLYDAGVAMSTDLAWQSVLMPMDARVEAPLKNPCFAKTFSFYHIAGNDGVGDVIRKIDRSRRANFSETGHTCRNFSP